MPSNLAAELKKRHGFASVAQELVLSLCRTTDRLQIELERFLAPFGLTGSQYNVLRILRGAGEPLPMQEIANRTVQVVPGMTGLIDRLEKAELVRRERSETDRRVIYVSITPQALAVLEKIDQPLLDKERSLLKGITESDQQRMIKLLEKIRKGWVEAE